MSFVGIKAGGTTRLAQAVFWRGKMGDALMEAKGVIFCSLPKREI